MKKLTIRIPQDRGTLYERIQYPAGEIQVRLTKRGLEACRRKDSYEIICNPIPDLIELAQLKDALDAMQDKQGSSQFWHSSLFLPYMPYARADRRFVKGDSHGLHVWGDLLNALGFKTVWTFDVHSRAAYDYIQNLANFSPTVRPVDQIAPIIRELGRKGLILVQPDAGAESRYGLSQYSLRTIQGLKHRDASTGALTGFGIHIGDHGTVERAQKALIIDDICDGGGTFIGLGQALHKINPKLRLYLYVSHGIFSKGQKELRKHFQDIYVSQYSFKATT